ncbi:hypothetical protein ACK35S_16465, partial [Aeromonas veronii]
GDGCHEAVGLKRVHHINSTDRMHHPEFKDISGNYIFAKETSPGKWWPVYIGQTNSLSTRLSHHEKEACAKSNGATHIHAHTSGNEATRLAEEKDLIVNWTPVCNGQHT